MRFYDREAEIALLREIREKSRVNARFTVVTGRRRVGKTQLIKRALEDEAYLYLYVSRKAEKDLCAGFQEEIGRVLNLPVVGTAQHFEELFRIVAEESKRRPVTLVIDEFQEFFRVNESVFSSMADIWDNAQKKSKLNLVVCGSVNRLMNRIFKDRSEPLYGRNTGLLHVHPFKVSVLKKILAEHSPRFTNDDLLSLWTMTGGVARYVEQLMDDGAFTRKKMLDNVFSLSSAYIDEGRVILSDEFGKEYGVYFSILSAISAGRTSFAEIKNIVGTDIGGQLTKLEATYAFISKKQPVFDKATNKNCLYQVDDCFVRFWFRFVYKYMHLIEQKKLRLLEDVVERDLDAFSGLALEQYFKAKFLEEGKYTRIGSWWDRKGENEIDLVCENEFSGALDFYEVKLDARRYDNMAMRTKVAAFFRKHPEMTRGTYGIHCVSVADM